MGQLSYPNPVAADAERVADDGVRAAKIRSVLVAVHWSVPYDRQVRMGSQIGKPAVISTPVPRIEEHH
jgi:hypothetical protein